MAFSKLLASTVAERKLPLHMTLSTTDDGFALEALHARATVTFEHQPARTNQHDNIVRQLSKLGNTPYTLADVSIAEGAEMLFIPSSLLAELRRMVVAQLEEAPVEQTSNQDNQQMVADDAMMPNGWQREYIQHTYLYNIANREARAFYQQHHRHELAPAYELSPTSHPLIMQCRHCLRYALGYCVRRGGRQPEWKEPLSLRLADGRCFELKFVCDECQMNIYAKE